MEIINVIRDCWKENPKEVIAGFILVAVIILLGLSVLISIN